MSDQELKDYNDCADFIRGCMFMGTGGGGNPDGVLDMLTSALDDGVPLRWTDVSQIPDDGWTCTVYRMGSTAPRDPAADLRLTSGMGLTHQIGQVEGMQFALQELQEYIAGEINVVVPG